MFQQPSPNVQYVITDKSISKSTHSFNQIVRKGLALQHCDKILLTQFRTFLIHFSLKVVTEKLICCHYVSVTAGIKFSLIRLV